jgi:hypothetical protein
MSSIEPGWHPDPYRRSEHRWWDGARWTDQISAGGVAGIDPKGADHVPPDRSLLELPALTVEFSATGLDRDGSWGIFERDGTTFRGRVVVDVAGFTTQTSYELQDTSQQPVLRIDELAGLTPDLLVRDHQAVEVGRMKIRGSRITLLAAPPAGPPGTVVEWGSTQVDGLRWGIGGTSVWETAITPSGAQVLNASGQPVGHIQVVDEGPGRPSWFILERDPEMPEPMRSVTVALIPAIGFLTLHTRAAMRRQRHDRRHGH